MDARPDAETRRFARRAAAFLGLGGLLYGTLFAGAEWLVYRQGHMNPFYRIARAPAATFDWVILGASHAMPLGFGDFNARVERALGARVLNLATPGTGVLYNRFVLEGLLDRHGVRQVLYVLDSFAFYDRRWNEERFADARLLRRTPLLRPVAGRLVAYAWREGVPAPAALDYLSGFSKITNPERFQRDVWEGEARFERTYRFSAARDRERLAYLYPAGGADPRALERYWAHLAGLVDLLAARGIGLVVIKTPLPAHIHAALPGEAAFDARVAGYLAARGVPFHDFSLVANDPAHFFDTDHLNRRGLTRFFDEHLRPVLARGARPPGPAAPPAGAGRAP
jgi:hypothetical protein